MPEPFKGFDPTQPDRKPQYSEPFNSGFTGEIFEPKKIWGENSPLTERFFQKPIIRKSYRGIGHLEIQGGWGQIANEGYAPTYLQKVEDIENFPDLFHASQSEENILKLVPLIYGYSYITPHFTEQSPSEIYLQKYEKLPHESAERTEEVVNEYFSTLQIKESDIDANKLLASTFRYDRLGAGVLASRFIDNRLKGDAHTTVEFIQAVKDRYGANSYRIAEILHDGLVTLVTKDGARNILPQVAPDPNQRPELYHEVTVSLAETALQQVKDASGPTENVFFPFNSIDEDRACSLDFYPNLMQSYALFCANLPDYIPKGRIYEPTRITTDMRNLYNHFFTILGVPKLQFKSADTLQDNAFYKKVLGVKRSLENNMHSTTDKGLQQKYATLNGLADRVITNIPYTESILAMPLHRLAQMNKERSFNSSKKVPTLGERLNDIRSYGARITTIRAAWGLLSGDPKEF